jgi:hypothetical protein
VQRTQRLVFLVLLIGWTIFRLVRYLRVAQSKRPKVAAPGPLPQPPATTPGAPAPTTPATAQSPIEPDGRSGSGRAGLLAAAAILVAGSALIWAILFAVPAFDDVPAIWRLTAGVLASLFLIRAARIAVARTGSGARRSKGDHRDPIK